MNVSTILDEALHELRLGVRTPMVPLLGAGMTGYLLIVLSSAQYMQEMGAADITRNSPHLVYLMSAGQGFWLLFAWAWMFSRVISRDHDAKLDEVVLAAPVHFPSLLIGRYVGVVVLGSLLGLVSTVGFLLVGPMEAAGMLPPGSTGPLPFGALLHAWLTLCVPCAVGLGALYVLAAIRTRNATGPFGVAAVLVLVWMVGMVVLRGGEIDAATATLIDPTAYGEIEVQTTAWTPSEKMSASIAFTPMLIANRVVWSLVPLVAMLWTVSRMHRERLVLGRPSTQPGSTQSSAPVVIDAGPPLEPVRQPRWFRVLWGEALWHAMQTFRGWGIRVAAGLLLVMGVAGSVVHVVAHARGPLLPRPELLTEVMGEFVYMVVVFVLAGFAGTMMRRDEQTGFDEIVGATPAPLWARLGGRAVAVAMLTAGLVMVPVMSGWIVTAMFVPQSFSVMLPLAYGLLAYAPALLELSGVAIVAHACFRRAGLAHAVTMVGAFVLVLNQELSLVAYPPAKIGIPSPVGFSELVGLGPWLPMLATMVALKVAIFGLCVGGALLVWPRQTVLTSAERIAAGFARLRGPAGVVCGGAVLSIVALLLVFDRQFIESERHIPYAEELAESATWEPLWIPRASAFAVTGGHVGVSVDPGGRVVETRWRLEGVRSTSSSLLLSMPEGVEIAEATVEGTAGTLEVSYGQAAVALGACAATRSGCRVDLRVVARWDGWPADGTAPWIHPSGAWLRAEDVLPRLGVDPDRRIRAVLERSAHALPREVPSVAPEAAVSVLGVAPAGDWQVDVQTPDGWTTTSRHALRGPLDFVVAWRPGPPARTEFDSVVAWHGPGHTETATEVLADLAEMRSCLHVLADIDPGVFSVVQAPRGGEPALATGVLWLPEDHGWDVGPDGYGRTQRRFEIAQAIAAVGLVERARLRRQPGSRWIVDGASGSLALRCVRQADGDGAWGALLARRADDITNALGSLVAPIEGLAEDGDAQWVEEYAPASVTAWSHQVGFEQAGQRIDAVVAAIGSGASVRDALGVALDVESASMLLGPPLASDLAIDEGDTVAGKRWSWSAGGWEPRGAAERVIVRRAETTVKRPVGTALEGDPAVVLDDWPSFERSIDDNVWKRPSDGG